MEYRLEKVSPTSVSVSVDCTAEEVSKAFDKAAKAIGKGMNLPGFRVGKVPTHVIKSRFASRVAADATELLADANLLLILKKENVRPLSPSQYRGTPAEEGKPFSFTAGFDTLPAIDLPDLSTEPLPVEAAGERRDAVADGDHRYRASRIRPEGRDGGERKRRRAELVDARLKPARQVVRVEERTEEQHGHRHAVAVRKHPRGLEHAAVVLLRHDEEVEHCEHCERHEDRLDVVRRL